MIHLPPLFVRRPSPRALWIALVLLTGVAGMNSLPGQFVYDDIPIVQENPLVQKLEHLPALFVAPYWSGDQAGLPPLGSRLYRPITMATYLFHYITTGPHPFFFKLGNLILHTLVVLLLYHFSQRWGLSPRGAFWTAALFAVMPIHAEAVDGVVGRAELLSAGGMLASWILVKNNPRPKRWGMAQVFFLGALLSKENAFVFPFALVLEETWGKGLKATLKERWAVWFLFFQTAGLTLLWRNAILGKALTLGEIPYFFDVPLLQEILTQSRFVFRHYFWPLLSGQGLRADFTRPSYPDATVGEVGPWMAVALLLGILIFCIAAWKKGHRGGLPLALFFAFLAPTIPLFSKGSVIGAERFLYWPSAFFCLGVGSLFENYFFSKVPHNRGYFPTLSLGFLMLMWGGQNIFRHDLWLNPESFWRGVGQESPNNPKAALGWGQVLASWGRCPEALVALERAKRLGPDNPRTDIAQGLTLFQMGNATAARSHFLRALQKLPIAEAAEHLGILAAREKKDAESLQWFEMAVAVHPYHPTYQRNLGLSYLRNGRVKEGLDRLEQYLRMAGRRDPTEDIRKYLERVNTPERTDR